jgi:hypothetical protein
MQMRGFTPDGRSVSSTRILKEMGDDAFTMQLKNRLIGDESLPDLAELKLVRKPQSIPAGGVSSGPDSAASEIGTRGPERLRIGGVSVLQPEDLRPKVLRPKVPKPRAGGIERLDGPRDARDPFNPRGPFDARGPLDPRAWHWPSWAVVGDWCDVDSAPIAYDYGTSIVRGGEHGEKIIRDGAVIATQEQYYDQALALGNSPQPEASDETEWMPLGVFKLALKESDPAIVLFSLSVSQEGAVRGSYANTGSPDQTALIQGAADKKTQRVAWTIGAHYPPGCVYEAGLFNLTQEKTPVFLHMGTKSADMQTLFRLHAPMSESGAVSIPPSR